MKVLVFEYISGGGLNRQALPASLAREGLLMLQALLDNCAVINGLDVLVMLDWRLVASTQCARAKIHTIQAEDDCYQQFIQLVADCDAVWPIAPESDGVLQQWCQVVVDSGKLLLTSPPSAVQLAGNKYLTYLRLLEHTITTVPTQLLIEATTYENGEWIVKAIDGVGGEDSYLITEAIDWHKIPSSSARYIIQPHLQGEKLSLSCLFKNGRAWLVSVNCQQFVIKNLRYQLTAIIVNYLTDKTGCYQCLVDNIAKAMPELWGYVGIDLIVTDQQIWVLEINPRLTTSFTGIQQALGINIAEQVLQLIASEPNLKTTVNQPITITLANDE